MPSDLISREALFDAMRDEEWQSWHPLDEIDAVIANAPAVDAVEVVRCCDCVCVSVCNDELVCSRISNVMDGYYHGTIDVVKPDDYCSYGVKRRAERCG